MHAILHPADIQDRDGGVLLISTLFGLNPFLRKLFADGGYQGPDFETGAAQFLTQVDVEIVKRTDSAKGFVLLLRRWGGSAHPRGSIGAAVSPRTSRTRPETHSPSSSSHRSKL